MIIVLKIPITVAMVEISGNHAYQLWGIWKKSFIPRDRNGEYEPRLIKKISEYCYPGHGGKDSLHVAKA